MMLKIRVDPKNDSFLHRSHLQGFPGSNCVHCRDRMRQSTEKYTCSLGWIIKLLIAAVAFYVYLLGRSDGKTGNTGSCCTAISEELHNSTSASKVRHAGSTGDRVIRREGSAPIEAGLNLKALEAVFRIPPSAFYPGIEWGTCRSRFPSRESRSPTGGFATILKREPTCHHALSWWFRVGLRCGVDRSRPNPIR